jgi:hypothetical protein
VTEAVDSGTGLVLVGALLAVVLSAGWVAYAVIVAGVAIVLIGAL